MPAKSGLKYPRVVLKISGEGLTTPGGFGLDPTAMQHVAREIRDVHRAGAQVAVVLGGGNFLRGATASKAANIPEMTAHQMGMLATVINALAVQEALKGLNVDARVMSAIPVGSMCELLDQRRCIRHLGKKRVVLLAGGTGRPFVTTDTAAAVAALEIGADALLKATKVDGVYDSDPMTNSDAKRYTKISYDQVLRDHLAVMDIAAFELCRSKQIPIIVFDLAKAGSTKKAVTGGKVGTIIS